MNDRDPGLQPSAASGRLLRRPRRGRPKVRSSPWSSSRRVAEGGGSRNWATRCRACWSRWPATSRTRWPGSTPSLNRRGWPRSRRSCMGDASSATLLQQLPAPRRLAGAVAGTRLFDKMRPPFNVTISSVRVPDLPLFLAGSRVAATYPVGPMAEGIGLNVTAFSYLDRVYFGISWPAAGFLPSLHEVAVHVDDVKFSGESLVQHTRRPGGDGLTTPAGRDGSERGRCGPLDLRAGPYRPFLCGGLVMSPTSEGCPTRSAACPTGRGSRCPCWGSSWSIRSRSSSRTRNWNPNRSTSSKSPSPACREASLPTVRGGRVRCRTGPAFLGTPRRSGCGRAHRDR